MTLSMDGSKNLTWTGSLITGAITVNGSPSFKLNLDERVQNEYDQSSWHISNYLTTSPNFAIP